MTGVSGQVTGVTRRSVRPVAIVHPLRVDLDEARESLARLSAKAFEDSCHKTNIRPCTQADLLRLYEESWR